MRRRAARSVHTASTIGSGTSTAGTASATACRNAARSTVVRFGAAGRLTAERTRAAKFEGSSRYLTSIRTSSRS
ncbi:hypothetical protein STENM327S_06025 [Streptomyces tendae]